MDYEKEPPPAYETIVHLQANYKDPPPYPKYDFSRQEQISK